MTDGILAIACCDMPFLPMEETSHRAARFEQDGEVVYDERIEVRLIDKERGEPP
jgi:hypothetical protein